ncbi:MAG: hypothetical protein K2O67_03910, partial [Clostridia bacterium]|nr:hypothetical protein [Clostridia bacterium]
PSCGGKLDFKTTFYYVCYDSPSDAHSASSISSVVHSYGGAGYIIEDGGNYFVTVSCYYTEQDAQSVCKTLSTKGLNCSVRKVEAGDYELRGNAGKNQEKYLGNLNTLSALANVCYNLANSLDDYVCDQSAAKSVLGDVKTGLQSLLRQNQSNCFSGELRNLIAECDDVSYGYVLSRDVRRLQIAITDSIVNIRLY